MRISYRGYLYEAVNINKDFLLKLVDGDVAKLNSHRELVSSIIEKGSTGFNSQVFPDKSRLWLLNILIVLSIKGTLPSDLSNFIHDILVDGKFNILSSLNSDSTVDDLREIMRSYRTLRMTASRTKLTKEEECIWLRVKLFHEFEDGYKWVNAVDANGELAGFIPSEVTFKTMNHCGNTPSVKPGDVYYGLRDSNDREYLSVIVDGEGKIRESKGRNNNRPTEDIRKYVQWLMKHENVKGTDYGAGYARHMNYGVSHMMDDSEFTGYVRREKPELIDATEGIILELKEKLSKGEITEGDVVAKYDRSNFEDFSFEQLIGVLGKNPFTEDQMIQRIKRGGMQCIEVANAGKEYLTIKIQHAFVDHIDDVRGSSNYDPDDDDDTTIPTFISIMSEVPNNNIDGYYLYLNYGDSIDLTDYDPDPIQGMMKNSKPMLDKIMAVSRLATYIIYDASRMPGGEKNFIKEYGNVIHGHIENELSNGSNFITKTYIEAAVKVGKAFAYHELLNLHNKIKSHGMALKNLTELFMLTNLGGEKTLDIVTTYKDVIYSEWAKSTQFTRNWSMNQMINMITLDSARFKFAFDFKDLINEYYNTATNHFNYDLPRDLLRLGASEYWRVFDSINPVKEYLSDVEIAKLIKAKPEHLINK